MQVPAPKIDPLSKSTSDRVPDKMTDDGDKSNEIMDRKKQLSDDEIKKRNRRLVFGESAILKKLKDEFEAAQAEQIKEPDVEEWTQADYTQSNDCKSSGKNYFRDLLGDSVLSSLGDFGVAYTRGTRKANGKIKPMEDEYIATTVSFADTSYPLFGVFDGHDGKDCATFVKGNLPNYLTEYLNKIRLNYPKESSKDKLLFPIFNLLKLPGVELGAQFREEKQNLSRAHIGCTSNFATINDGFIYVSNIGDSRCIISSNGKPIALSRDAKPDKENILKGIKKRRGWISKSEVPRVKGVLAVGRAIGHHEGRSGINPRAKIIRYPLKDLKGIRNYLIIATDGFWENVSNRQAAQAVQELAKKGSNAEQIALALTRRAKVAGDSTEDLSENITVIIVNLQQFIPYEE